MLKNSPVVFSSPLAPANNVGSAEVDSVCGSSCRRGQGYGCIEVCNPSISERNLEADVVDRQTI